MEYEYSYKVNDLKEYLNYLDSNYKFVEKYKEKRVIYRCNDLIARVTHKKNILTLSFKENKITNDDLNIRRESKEMIFENIDNCENILSFLGFKKDNTLVRYRSIYKGKNITFEIDEYVKPEVCYVVSFEGEKKTCDKVNLLLKDLNKKYKIN